MSVERRLLIVIPRPPSEGLQGTQILDIPPLGPRVLSELTKRADPAIEVQIVDERQRSIDKYLEDKTIDAVAITATTPSAPRAYEISEKFRERGVITIMGGIHANFMTPEALGYVDSVVRGEAEKVWPKVLVDLKKRELKPIYEGGRLDDMSLVPSVGAAEGYRVGFTTEYQRGCPNVCNFCSVTAFNGRKVRRRPIENVIPEIRTAKENGAKQLMFTDDNIYPSGTENQAKSLEFLKALADADLGIKWASQTDINLGLDKNQEALRMAAKSGCITVFIGFESITPQALRERNKGLNLQKLKEYVDAVKRIREHGIAVLGGFIFGNDSDDPGVFERTSNFIHEAGIDASQFSFLTPLPGTQLYQDYSRQGRLLYTNYPKDWSKYDVLTPVIEPKGMSADRVMEGMNELYRESGTFIPALKHGLSAFAATKSLLAAGATYMINRGGWEVWSDFYGNFKDENPPREELVYSRT